MMYTDATKRKRFNEVLSKVIELEKIIRAMPDDFTDLDFMTIKRDCGIYSATIIAVDTLPKAESILQKLQAEYDRYMKKSA